MSKNYMEEISKMFGVELGEEFDVEYCNLNPYRFTEDGLLDCKSNPNSGVLEVLLIGKAKIIKKPWKPKEGEEYYYIVYGVVYSTIFHNTTEDNLMRLRMGNFFRTREEAESNKERWLEYIKREPDFSWRLDG